MLSRSTLGLLALVVGAIPSGPAAAQGNDPLTRYLNGLFNTDKAARPEDSQRRPKAGAAAAKAKSRAPKTVVQPSRPAAEEGRSEGATVASAAAEPVLPALPTAEVSGLEPASVPVPSAASSRPLLPIVTAAAQQQPALPSTPAAALDRLNAFFNSIDALTASFVQTGGGQRSQGTLQLKRPGQLRFAYAPPSTLEIVSDGRSLAIRDKKLGTNDVYPIGQTPLKFLLQEDFDLARDTKVRNVQTNPDGTIIVRFDDSATFGGTSKITLHFDARRNRLKQWTVVDPQGYETQVVLSDVEVVTRGGTR